MTARTLAIRLAASVATAVAAVPAVALAPAAAAVVQPSYSCSTNASAKVEADWLRVHTAASVGSSAVGQLPAGAVFHYCTSSGRWNPKPTHYWYYGYGYHGSTRLTGWVDASFLNYGP